MRPFAIAALLFAVVGLPSIAPDRAPVTPQVSAGPQAIVAAKAVASYAQAQTKPAPVGQQPDPKPKPPQPPALLVPDEVHVNVGELSQILIQADADAKLHYEWVGKQGASAFREYDPDPAKVSYQVLGHRPGVFYLVVFAVRGDQVAKATCKIVVDPASPPTPTPPGPGPGPGPQPPVPVPPQPGDPLAAQLQQLYATDAGGAAEKLATKTALASVYGTMALQLQAGQYATLEEVSKALTAQAAAAGLGLNLLALRKACAAEVSAAVGPAPAAKLDAPLRAKLVSTFGRLKSCLDAVK